MAGAAVGSDSAWAPKIAVEDEHGCRDRTAEEYLAVTANAPVGKTAPGPKETHMYAEEGFVYAEVATNGTTMEDVEEDKAAQGRRDNDEE